MSIKDYAEVLRFAIQLQVDEVKKELSEEIIIDENERYLEGIKQGLEIALQKIEASKFLMEK